MHLIFIPSLKVLNHSWIQIRFIKKTCPKISELPCKFPLPACCGAPNQSICPLYFCDAVYFLYGQFDFLYGKLFTFYMVNSTFYMIKPTFHMVNFSLTISVSVKRRPQSSDCKLQTGDKVQTEGKMQTEDCRPEINCRLGHKTTRFTGKTLKVSWDRGRVNCERRATDVLNFTSSDGFGVDILFLR